MADLTQPDDLHALEKRIVDEATLDLLVNNAGFAGYMPFATLVPDEALDRHG